MTSATIKLFLPSGDAKGLRTAEVSNWSGKALAAPRTELTQLLEREECTGAGVYVLIGTDPASGAPHAYIGEAESVRERLRQHRSKEFWVSAIVFVSKDETLTKAHVRYLESRLLSEARAAGRVTLEQNVAGGARLTESDRDDMEVFLARVRQLLPILGSDLLSPIARIAPRSDDAGTLLLRSKGALARGQRTQDGFVVYEGSTAVIELKPSAEGQSWTPVRMRERLIADGTLVEHEGFLRFTKNVEFTSPSTAAGVIVGGSANGLRLWKSSDGTSLKELEERT